MKKKSLIFILCLFGIMAFNINISIKGNNEGSCVTLENIEALANNGESLGHACGSLGSVDCPISPIKVEFVY